MWRASASLLNYSSNVKALIICKIVWMFLMKSSHTPVQRMRRWTYQQVTPWTTESRRCFCRASSGRHRTRRRPIEQCRYQSPAALSCCARTLMVPSASDVKCMEASAGKAAGKAMPRVDQLTTGFRYGSAVHEPISFRKQGAKAVAREDWGCARSGELRRGSRLPAS
jgi:hypothetical protein